MELNDFKDNDFTESQRKKKDNYFINVTHDGYIGFSRSVVRELNINTGNRFKFIINEKNNYRMLLVISDVPIRNTTQMRFENYVCRTRARLDAKRIIDNFNFKQKTNKLWIDIYSEFPIEDDGAIVSAFIVYCKFESIPNVDEAFKIKGIKETYSFINEIQPLIKKQREKFPNFKYRKVKYF